MDQPPIPSEVPVSEQTDSEYGILGAMARRRKKRNWFRILLLLFVVGAVAYGAYWFADRQGWLLGGVPSRPPTAAERARMEEVDRASATIAPNAVPGAGVRPRGSLPPKETLPVATTTPTEADAVQEAGEPRTDPTTEPEELPDA